MSSDPTTIILNRALNHSITYNPSNDSLTAHLSSSSSKPIEKVQNRLKLMLLIYFVQRDAERETQPSKIDGEVSMELRIVERIIWQFSTYTQATRSLREYTEVGDHIDMSRGMGPTRANRNATGTSRPSKMIITKEVRDTLLEWLKDILSVVCYMFLGVTLNLIECYTRVITTNDSQIRWKNRATEK